MLFTEEFLSGVDENPVGSIVAACDLVICKVDQSETPWSASELEALMEGAALVSEVIGNHDLSTENYEPEIDGDLRSTCEALRSYLGNIKREFQAQAYVRKFSAMKEGYKTALKVKFAYEFSQGDLERIQELINELRECLMQNTSFEEKHRQRLLSRLEKLQAELHKRVSDLDRFWGMVGDAGVVLGKLGEDAKPIVDRIREMTRIVWRTQARAEELPSGAAVPVLEDDAR